MEFVLTVDCKDSPGIIYRITEILYRAGVNITSQAEYVDREFEHFFLRAEFSGDADPGDLEQALGSLPFEASRINVRRKRIKPVVVFAGKEPHCLGDLLLRHTSQELHANIAAVISNRSQLRELVERFDIPFLHIPSDGRKRERHEQEVLEALEEFEPEVIVLAKYMRVLTPDFVERFPNRILNIHHSFLPAFVGARPYHRAHKRGVKIIGATAHFVTPALDEGPIISQDVVPVNHRQTVADLIQAGRDVEKIVLARALRLVLEERVFVFKNRTVVFD